MSVPNKAIAPVARSFLSLMLVIYVEKRERYRKHLAWTKTNQPSSTFEGLTEEDIPPECGTKD